MGRRFKWHMFFTSFLPLWVSMVLFDNESVVIHDRLPLGRVPRMTEKEYFTRGCTALLDAVGGAIHHIGNIHMLIVGYTDMMLTHERAYAPNGSRMASVLCQKLSEKMLEISTDCAASISWNSLFWLTVFGGVERPQA